MNATEFRSVTDFESGLKPGDAVRARWTWCRCALGVEATVKRVNAQSIRVTITADIGPYKAGHEIVVPRFAWGSGAMKWSYNNRVEPLCGYAGR